MQVETGGVIRGCGCSAYVIQACPKEAVVVWTLTKVIRLEGTVLAWEEFQRSSYCFTQNGGVPGESADVQPAWWLDLKATSDERMCCADGYESILGFSFPWCHQTLLHRAKITMSSWHSVLPMHCPHTTFPGSLIFSAQRFCTSTKDTCLDVSLTGTATTN